MRGWEKTFESAWEAVFKLAARLTGHRQDGVPSDRRAVVDWRDSAPRTFASGGYIVGFDGSRGDVPVLIHPGDFRIRREVVEKYGKDFLEQLNSSPYYRPEKIDPSLFKLGDHLLGEGGVVGGQSDQHGDDLGLVDPPVQPPSTSER